MNQKFQIRREEASDYHEVIELTAKAFKNMPFADGDEDKLVDRLHNATNFNRELSLVAESEGKILGHIIFTPAVINNGQQTFKTLVLGPVSVLPEFQKQGIGGELIKAGHKKAINCGFDSVILIGHPEYYPRFGYKPASGWGIKTHYQLPSDDVFMAVELKENALKNITGMVMFPPEFG